MHPLLAHPGRLLLHLLVWVAIGFLLGVALHMVDQRPWLDAFAFSVPMALIYGSIVLTAWWVCRANPLNRGLSSVMVQLGAAAQSSAVWVAVAAAWAVFLDVKLHLGPGRAGIFRDLVV